MENDDYLNDYREFFQYFDDTLDPSDQLPVKLASYRLLKNEVVGAIFNWTNQYLSEKKCPWHLISFLARIVIEKTRKRCKKQPIVCGFNPSDNAYEPLQLMHTVIEVINEVCSNYKLSLSVQNLAVSNPLPPPEAAYSVISVSALKNTRRKMEDRLIVIHDLNTIFTKQDATPSHYYAVFDGHDGEHAAAYSANHLHQYLAESTNFTTDPEQAIQDAFCRTDSMFLNKCEVENIVSGTTAVCALLLPKEKTLYIAWVGDSLAALVSQGKILPCVKPHKPDRQDERLRIEKDGGMVIHWGVWRVNGQLGVSRAIGDAEYKPYVTAVPEIVKIPLSGEEDFFVLGSDGLWDHILEVEIARVVYDAVCANPDKAELVSRELVQLAKQSGSTDNISVIVVFLRDPQQIAAGPRWTNRVVSMDTLDNANNPFAIPNKTDADSITSHNDDGLLLNITDGLKKNDDMANNDLIKMLEKSNCERLTPEFDEDDNLGPETDVDNLDDGSISVNSDVMQRQLETIDNNQNFNPFKDIEKSLEINLNLKEGTFEGLTTPTEESCPLPTNSVHNVSQIIETGAESDSEEDEEWNYVRGEEANKENLNPLQLNSQVAEEEEEDTEDTMSQLNPNAAEFVPISPTRNVASPLGRVLSDDLVLSQSPKKPPSNEELDLNIPSPVDFENDISQKPHEIEEAISNGHQNDLDNDICVTNSAPNNKTDEFLFGPNAAPFTPVKLLDQSEVSSTKAVYGDESDLSQIMSFNDSTFSQDQNEFVQKDDPMSMSFHQDRIDDGNPFDLNKVHQLPEDVDAFIAKADKSDSLLNDTISDLDEHFPLGKPQESGDILITDLDNKDFKHEDNKVTSTLEDDIVEPLKQLGLDTSCEQNRTSSPLEEAITPLVEEVNSTTPFEVKEFSSSVEENQSISPLQEDIASPVEEEIGFSVKEESLISPQETIFPVEEKAMSFLVDERETSSPEDEKEIISHLEEKEKNSQVEEKEISSPIEQKEFESAAEEDRLNNPLVDQIIKNDFVSEFEGVESSHVFESSFEPLQVSTSCDNSESPQHSEPVTSEPSPNNDEFVKLETEKSDIEKAKENVDNLLNLDPLSSAKYSEEQCLLPDTTVNEIVNINEPSSVPINSDLLCALSTTSQDEPEQEIKKEEINEEQHISSIQQENKDVVSSSITEPNQIPDSFDDSTRSIDVDSHSTPEIDHLLGNNSDAACLLNNSVKSTVDTESVTTTEVNSFLQRSLLAEMESPLSPNVSEIHLDVDEQAVLPTVNVQSPVGDLLQVECAVESTLLSPNRDEQHITGVTSTPAPEKSSPLSPLIPEVKAGIPLSPVEDKTPKAPPKEGDKKTTKQKATPVSSTKKTPTPRSSLAGAKAPTPSPRPASSKLSAKASPVPSKVNSTTKTESKTNVKPLVSAAPKSSTTTARVPLASRTKPATVTKTTENKTLTNGEAKPSRPASGAVKKTLEVSSARSAASTGTGKPTSTTAKVPLASARGAVPATVPKPRPNTLKPAPSKTTSATATKSTTSVKATTAPKVPPAQKTSASLANKDVKAPITKTFPKPRPATEKHIKETANKLTASRTTTKTTSTTQVLSKTSITRKTDEKVTGTKTTTSRTSTTTATARPISRGTKTSATKVGKPKENGVATVHTEQIIVSDVNGINSNEQFVKDNSPVDNKLIVDSLTETAAI